MAEEKISEHLQGRLRVFVILGLHAAGDTTFCCVTAALNWLAEHFVFGPMAVDGFDGGVLLVLRIIVGFGLCAVTAVVVLEDIIKAGKEAYKRLRAPATRHQ